MFESYYIRKRDKWQKKVTEIDTAIQSIESNYSTIWERIYLGNELVKALDKRNHYRNTVMINRAKQKWSTL